MTGSVPAEGRTVRHEVFYRYLYAPPKGELACYGILLPKHRDKRRTRTSAGQSAAIAGMVSVEDRLAEVADPCVVGHWEVT